MAASNEGPAACTYDPGSNLGIVMGRKYENDPTLVLRHLPGGDRGESLNASRTVDEVSLLPRVAAALLYRLMRGGSTRVPVGEDQKCGRGSALAATGVGLLSACGFVPARPSLPPPPPAVARTLPSGIVFSTTQLVFSATPGTTTETQSITLRNTTDHACERAACRTVSACAGFHAKQRLPSGEDCAMSGTCTNQSEFLP